MRVALVLALALAACPGSRRVVQPTDDGSDSDADVDADVDVDADADCDEGAFSPGCPCDAVEPEICYDGPPATRGVGACVPGFATCDADGTWSSCQGEILPALELCNHQDDDCNGEIDEGVRDPVCDACDCGDSVDLGPGDEGFSPADGTGLISDDAGCLVPEVRGGVWSHVFDAICAGKIGAWNYVVLDAVVPDGAEIDVELRSAQSEADLARIDYRPVASIPPDDAIVEMPDELRYDCLLDVRITLSGARPRLCGVRVLYSPGM